MNQATLFLTFAALVLAMVLWASVLIWHFRGIGPPTLNDRISAIETQIAPTEVTP